MVLWDIYFAHIYEKVLLFFSFLSFFLFFLFFSFLYVFFPTCEIGIERISFVPSDSATRTIEIANWAAEFTIAEGLLTLSVGLITWVSVTAKKKINI
jgi:hypothetical protein